MPFPTVRDDPYKKNRPRRRRGALWPEAFWTRLVKQAMTDHRRDGWVDVSPACREMIADMNRECDAG